MANSGKIKKIVIIGPESTGKSTLSKELAKHYNVARVPEFARTYLNNLGREYTKDDLLIIAKEQLDAENREAEKTESLLFCDTDLRVIKIWSEHKFGDCDPWIVEQIKKRKYDLYLLTYIDVPWQYDPLREHPEPTMREYFYRIHLNTVINSGVDWADIRGDYNERIRHAVAAVDDLLKK